MHFSYISILPGHTYGFMMKSTHDIGRLSRITFKWAHDSHWYNPLSWSLFSHPALYVESVDIVNGETQDRYFYSVYFCFNRNVITFFKKHLEMLHYLTVHFSKNAEMIRIRDVNTSPAQCWCNMLSTRDETS